ncbi:MAG TPA: ester cyclase [Thermoanaerobaculia bacterium]|nr:ester cyclase [Thermoanaerobaculia bacterium]
MASQSNQTVEFVRRLFKEVFEGGKVDAADEILTPDFTFQYPFPGFPPGAEGIKEFVKTFHQAFPKFEVEVHDLFGDADGVAIRWTLRGHHKGSLLGIPASDKYVTISAIGVYRNHGHGGRLTSGWLELDTLGLLQQIGTVPPTNQLLPGLKK